MLNQRNRYLQLAFNHDSELVYRLLPRIPRDPRILIEVGTPYIKREGRKAIELVRALWEGYIVADIKTVDGAEEEVREVASAGANAATVVGSAPTETINLFIESCERHGIDSFIDMIGIKDPLRDVLIKLRSPPDVVVLHKGRDEESVRNKVINYSHIKRIRSKYDVLVSAAGGIDLRGAQSASFNGANIVTVNIVRPDDPFEGIVSDSQIEKLAVEFLEGID